MISIVWPFRSHTDPEQRSRQKRNEDARRQQIALSGAILVRTVVGLAIFLAAVLVSPETRGKILIADLTVA